MHSISKGPPPRQVKNTLGVLGPDKKVLSGPEGVGLHRNLPSLELFKILLLTSAKKNSHWANPVLEKISRRLKSGKGLSDAFRSLDSAEQKKIIQIVGQRRLEALFFLSKETDRELFWNGVLRLGLQLRAAGNNEQAYGVLRFLKQNSPQIPPSIQKKVQREYLALLGKGDLGTAFESFTSHFIDEATSSKWILPLMGAGMVGSLAKTGVLSRLASASKLKWFHRGLGPEFISGLGSYLAEVPSFVLMSRGIRQAYGEEVGSLYPELMSAGMGFAVFKAFGSLGQRVTRGIHRVNELGQATRLPKMAAFNQAMVPSAMMLTGFMAAHGLEAHFGLRRASEGSSLVRDSLLSLLTFGIGIRLGHRFLSGSLPAWEGIQRGVAERTDHYRELLRTREPSPFQKLSEPIKDWWRGPRQRPPQGQPLTAGLMGKARSPWPTPTPSHIHLMGGKFGKGIRKGGRVFESPKESRGPKASEKTIPKGRRGRPKKYTDEQLAEALERHGGNQSAAARELGYSSSGSISIRIKEATSNSPLAKFKRIKGRPSPPKKYTDEQLAEALERHGGNRRAVARELGYNNTQISRRVNEAKSNSPLAKFKNVKGKVGRKKKYTDEQLAEVLERIGGNRSAVASELGYNANSIRIRIKEANSNSPLAKFQKIGGTTRRFADAEIAKVLERYEGNRSAAARELGYDPSNLSHRIKKAEPNSPLAKFKKLKGKGDGSSG